MISNCHRRSLRASTARRDSSHPQFKFIIIFLGECCATTPPRNARQVPNGILNCEGAERSGHHTITNALIPFASVLWYLSLSVKKTTAEAAAQQSRCALEMGKVLVKATSSCPLPICLAERNSKSVQTSRSIATARFVDRISEALLIRKIARDESPPESDYEPSMQYQHSSCTTNDKTRWNIAASCSAIVPKLVQMPGCQPRTDSQPQDINLRL